MSNLSVAFEGKTKAEVRETAENIVSLMKEGKITKDELSIRDIAESTLGSACLQKLSKDSPEGSAKVIQEATDPVNSTAFTNITQTLIMQGVLEAYKAPEFIGSQLVSEETSNEDNTREPGIAPIDDNALEVKEGEEYPDTKFGEDYIDVPRTKKRGLRISLTREIIFFDKTDKVLEMAQSIGKRLGTDKEKRILRVFAGLDNSFSRKGVAANTYLTTGARINKKASTPLADWTSVDTAMQLFTAMKDDRTLGEPIAVTPKVMVVSAYKVNTAKRILNATEVREATNTGNRVTISGNPINAMSVLSSVWLDWLLVNEGGVSATNAADYWYIGDPKTAFRYRTLFPLSVRAKGPNSDDDFDRDVVAQFRADERGGAYIRAPWYVAQLYNA
jgi:hypothetical protein